MPIPATECIQLEPYWSAPGAALYLGDARACLQAVPARSVQCCVTSPPYWGLRDYGTGNTQIGLEEIPDCFGWVTKELCGVCYVCRLVKVLSEVKRVLRDDGTMWLNLGDSYNSSGNLVGIPWRSALALQADGWILRAVMPWVKRNAMPDSAENRPGRSVEDVFLLTKSMDYYFDMESIKLPGSGRASGGSTFSKPGGAQHRTYDRPDYRTRGFRSGDLLLSEDSDEVVAFAVPVANYSGAHYATFPVRLVTPMILAGTSSHGACANCNSPYRPVVSKERTSRVEDDGYDRDRSIKSNRNGLSTTLYDHIGGGVSDIIGWKKECGCQTSEVIPCVVLDPFVGSGTTVATALQLGRHGIGIDLSEQYLRENAIPRIEEAMSSAASRQRTSAVPPGAPPAPRRLR